LTSAFQRNDGNIDLWRVQHGHTGDTTRTQKKGFGVVRGQTPRRRRRSISQVFESLTNDFVERLLRVPCTLEELQRGIGQVQDGLATLERSIAEERLRS
jgi:hypothetical protein